MAENSGFFSSVSGDRKYNMDFLAHWMASVIGNGTYDGELAVAAGNGMTVTLPAGRAWINGYHYRNDGPLTLSVDNADGVLHRKDTVVLRWDVNARAITAQVLRGAPASNPIAPAIVRSAEQYDLKIAEIYIPAGTTAISQSLITDTRLDNSVCGIVTGVVKQVDTTKLYQQIQDDLARFRSVNEADFTAWVAGLKEVLDDSTAGNLLNLIDSRAYTTLSCAKTDTTYALTGLSATTGKVPVLFAADAAYAAGDTVEIDSTAYALATRDGSALVAGAWAAGKVVTGIADIDAKVLTVGPSNPVGSATKSKTYTATLTASGWAGNAAPYSYTLSVPAVTATSANEILPGVSITADQLDLLQSANIQDGGQAAGSITLLAYGGKPTADLPIRIIVRGDL